MAVNKTPFVVASTEAESTAALFRQAISSFLNPAGGTVAGKGLTVKAKATPNMEVEVEGGDPNGQIWIPGTSLPNQGIYFCSVDSTSPIAIGAASTANPRIDTIVARVKDSFYAGSANEFLLEVIAGTPTAGISKPPKTQAEAKAVGVGALPASSYALAYVLVPQNASSITSGDIENVATQCGLGPVALPMKPYSANVTANVGETLLATANITVTLPPSPEENAMVGIWGAGTETTIKASGGKRISGDFISGAETIKLAELQHVILQMDPYGQWVIVAGEPTSGKVYSTQVERTLGIEYEPSTTRPVFVVLECVLPHTEELIHVSVGGVLITNVKYENATGLSIVSCSFICPPKVKWEAKRTGESASIFSSYLTL